jgi:hypothetical protein
MQFPARGMADMLKYLSKFVLQMLPTISATVIGAYIVSTWINPKTPPEPAKLAARAQDQKPAQEAPAPATAQPAQEAATEAAEAKPAETKPAEAVEAPKAETPKAAKAASGPDKIRIIPIVRQPAQTAEAPVPSTTPASTASAPEPTGAAEERKDANELARAAIQRLRGSTETARTADEPAKPATTPARTQQVRAAPEAAQPPAATVAPPLPPAVSIASPRIAPADSPDQAASVYPDRMSPPAEIPASRSPLNLQANHRVAENPSLADDFLSATKSFFRAITPQ